MRSNNTKAHYRINSSNPAKIEALRKGLELALKKEIAISALDVINMPDVKPTTFYETLQAATDGVNAVVRTYLTPHDHDGKVALAINFQKGVDLKTSVLVCIIAVRRTDSDQVYTAECERISISPTIGELVAQGIAIYEAYRRVYGDDVADKKISLLEKIKPELSEIDWMANGALPLLY